MLQNPVSSVAYVIVLFRFFLRRIKGIFIISAVDVPLLILEQLKSGHWCNFLEKIMKTTGGGLAPRFHSYGRLVSKECKQLMVVGSRSSRRIVACHA